MASLRLPQNWPSNALIGEPAAALKAAEACFLLEHSDTLLVG